MFNLHEGRMILERLIVALCRASEHAEARLDGLNDQLRQLYQLGVLAPMAVVGPVVLTRPYAPGGPTDSGQAVRAVLTLPTGFGAVYWDTEDSAFHEDADDLKRAALARVVPFEECEPAVRGLLAPHAAALLSRLLRSHQHVTG